MKKDLSVSLSGIFFKQEAENLKYIVEWMFHFSLPYFLPKRRHACSKSD